MSPGLNYNPTLNAITMSDDYFITYRALPHRTG
ncbi:hypothetical protein J2W32_005425 [Variovorax boronicumulans]|uniref:Uncharacterized protein n=1 Tax=Variovorax boronicumulans TaxID=436515 RepID=A0AAW8D6D2_9BURK|nr:hypothetical protein [Variovorax boronicumulans]MDQ0044514.1 hypothetical protein [Variovorax boronicumulans]MDQ0056357.1 hypothetical protein [Variovorax boronicumulans]